MTQLNSNLRQYLLGNLPEAESDALEIQIMSDDQTGEEVALAESNLIEDFLENSLTPAETELFTHHYLILPERRKKLELVYLLKKRAMTVKAIPETTLVAEQSFFDKLKEFFSSNLRPLAVAVSLLIVAAVIGIIFLVSRNSAPPNTLLAQQTAELNRANLSNPADIKNAQNLNLFPGLTRGNNTANVVAQNQTAETVFFKLALVAEMPPNSELKLKLLKDKKVLLTQEKIRVYENSGGTEVRWLLPVKPLEKGDYQIEVSANDSTQSVLGVYSFTVK